MKQTLLIVDDEIEYATLIGSYFKSKNIDVVLAQDTKSALDILSQSEIHIVLLDIMLGDDSGIELIEKIKILNSDTPIIMNSCLNDTKYVVSAMKAGASDYIQKGVKNEELYKKITEFLQFSSTIMTEKELMNSVSEKPIIGNSYKTKQLIKEISKVSQSDATVFLRGETGTGKNLVAELIHQYSNRKNYPFVTINCATIPGNLLESELFGHEKGAFTGAIRHKKGKFEHANFGTIFLDEIGELTPELQVKILRVIQSQEFESVGGLKTIKVNVRIIAATNRNIEDAVQQNQFREDLYYRLNVLPIFIPPLRERREDVISLIQYYFNQFSKKANKNFNAISHHIIKKLVEYNWPGNVRELQNVIERALIIGREPHLKPTDFAIPNAPVPQIPIHAESVGNSPVNSVWDLEYKALIKAIEQSGGNMTKAASFLGIGRNTLYNRLKKYNIKPKSSYVSEKDL